VVTKHDKKQEKSPAINSRRKTNLVWGGGAVAGGKPRILIRGNQIVRAVAGHEKMGRSGWKRRTEEKVFVALTDIKTATSHSVEKTAVGEPV